MKTYKECMDLNGVYDYDGEKYILLQDAFLTSWYGNGYDGYAHYEAKCVPLSAVEGCMDGAADGYDADGNDISMLMVWEILPDHDVYDEDEGDACDWEHPEGVYTR